MTTRRNLLIGGTCLLTAGAAYALKPRRVVSLLPPGQKFDGIVPTRFGDWTSRDVGDLFAPATEDSLAAKLYESTVGRIYRNATSDAEIMALFAYGGVQSNLLQLHRPEVCYPAFGYTIVTNRTIDVPLTHRAVLPARRLTLRSPQSQQTVLYWTRLGEFLPTSGPEQRLDRMKTALAGYIADGLLARFSMAGEDDGFASRTMVDFIGQLLRAVPARQLPGLIGTERARVLNLG